MSKTLAETLFDSIKPSIMKASDIVFNDVPKTYINNWYNSVKDKFKDVNVLSTLLACTPEDIVNDIYKSFVIPKVVDSIIAGNKALEEHKPHIEKELRDVLHPVVFNAYYNDIRSIEMLTVLMKGQLKIKLATPITFKELVDRMEVLCPTGNEVIRFTVANPEKYPETIIYKAFATLIGGEVFYGFYNIVDYDWAAMAKGIDNVCLDMLSEYIKYNAERYEVFRNNGVINPTVYVLE